VGPAHAPLVERSFIECVTLSGMTATETELPPPAVADPDIYHAIPLIIGDLPAIGKDRQMSGGGQSYKYRGIEDILPHIKTLFARYGVHLTPVFDVITDEPTTTTTGKPTRRVVVKGMFRFSANDGSFVAAQTIGEAMDSGDKSMNKAMTAALKAAIVQTFSVADGDDPDHSRPELEDEPVVRYLNFDTLKALGPVLKATGLDEHVRGYAAEQGIDLRPGHDEERLALVVAVAQARLTERANSHGDIVTVVTPGPPAIPGDTDVVAQARKELDEALARAGAEGEPAVEADPMAKIMEQFGPGTEVVDGQELLAGGDDAEDEERLS